ncbi:MAG: hypothetical protein LBH96_02880 [Candidatus Peribacteria bacterium]|jgi:uncharacterized membrane protein|nr:hypothetical protein [Candidatus Peribacteria bacterium]
MIVFLRIICFMVGLVVIWVSVHIRNIEQDWAYGEPTPFWQKLLSWIVYAIGVCFLLFGLESEFIPKLLD